MRLSACRPTRPRSSAGSHLLNDIKYLASDELEGRGGIGTKGLNKAADYIKEQFKEAGLDVTQVKGDAFQYFKMTTKAILGTPNTLKFVGPGGKTIELKRDVDFGPLLLRRRRQDQRRPRLRQLRASSTNTTSADFKGIDVKGKVVIAWHATQPLGQEGLTKSRKKDAAPGPPGRRRA